ncbi:hypothetical protein, partial [Thiolapillus sp.]
MYNSWYRRATVEIAWKIFRVMMIDFFGSILWYKAQKQGWKLYFLMPCRIISTTIAQYWKYSHCWMRPDIRGKKSYNN